MDASPEPATIPLPPPPPPADRVDAPSRRPGQLTSGWSTVFWLTWSFAAGALVAVWVSVRTTGLSTWWLGPESDPVPLLVSILVFVPPISLAIAALTHRRWLPWWGIVGSIALGLVAWGDADRVPGYAAVELTIALGGLLVSVAAFAGMLRAPRSR